MKAEDDLQVPLTTEDEVAWTKGEKQENKCRDFPFAILFYAHLISMIVVAAVCGVPALGDRTDSVENSSGEEEERKIEDYRGIFYLSLVSGVASLGLTCVSFAIMIKIGAALIKVALLTSISLSLVFGVSCIMVGQVFGAILGFLGFLCGCCYARMVWSRIPFAAANLKTGLKAVNTNYGVVFVAFFFVILGLVYTALWALCMIGVYDAAGECYEEDDVDVDADADDEISDDDCERHINGGYVFLLLLAFFWSQQVIQNTIQVTVAGTVGSWWFAPEENRSCCSSAVTSSACRATTTSFGSICFGSLIVAIIQTLRAIIESARNDQDGIILCLLDCLISCLQNLVEYFNKWAFIYVGLYGYPYLKAGSSVMTLFRERGWNTIITDDLITSTLLLCSFVAAGLTGLVGIAIDAVEGDWLETFDDDAQSVAFLTAFVIGLMLSSIMLSVVASSVNTIIVLFAEAPSEFETNHPVLSGEMRAAWRKAYPGTCGF